MRRLVSTFGILAAIGILASGVVVQAEDIPTINPAGEVIPTAPVPVDWLRVEINIPARELRLIERERIVGAYPVAIGQVAYKSIVMEDFITRIEWNPWWYPPPSPWAAGSSVTPPGPKNPLGPVKLPLSHGIRIHGTNKESSVGRAASHGCFRMRNTDAVTLAWYLQTHLTDKGDQALLEKYGKHRGTTFHVALDQPVPITIVYEPVRVKDDVLYLYPDVYGKVRNWFEKIANALTAEGIDVTKLEPERVDGLRRDLRKGPLTIHLQDLFRAPQGDQTVSTNFSPAVPK
ncbi:MAG: L,D-transpeptidase family protein [Deltaproteobacteria bacterium]|nr:L,D-transpeptidase family protein [Deltaproteobacteria bacterium]